MRLLYNKLFHIVSLASACLKHLCFLEIRAGSPRPFRGSVALSGKPCSMCADSGLQTLPRLLVQESRFRLPEISIPLSAQFLCMDRPFKHPVRITSGWSYADAIRSTKTKHYESHDYCTLLCRLSYSPKNLPL